jgi:hypothetical protein
MLTLALEESLQVASNPAFATPDQENILGGHDSYFAECLVWCLLIAEKRVLVSVKIVERLQGGADEVGFIMQGA